MPAAESARARLGDIASDVTAYYTGTLAQHGATPRGVDWSCKPTQELRFIQLLRVCSFKAAFSLNDVGCGYGALRGFLRQRHRRAKIDYLGVDLSQAMVASARSRWGYLPETKFETVGESLRIADYSIASGLFNVRLQHCDADWERWVAHTLQNLHNSSQIGFAVNFLIPPQLGEASPKALYRPAIGQWTSFCENDLASDVESITGYGMREYTLLVRSR
jgi:SAM-dependent methyltransferase